MLPVPAASSCLRRCRVARSCGGARPVPPPWRASLSPRRVWHWRPSRQSAVGGCGACRCPWSVRGLLMSRGGLLAGGHLNGDLGIGSGGCGSVGIDTGLQRLSSAAEVGDRRAGGDGGSRDRQRRGSPLAAASRQQHRRYGGNGDNGDSAATGSGVWRRRPAAPVRRGRQRMQLGGASSTACRSISGSPVSCRRILPWSADRVIVGAGIGALAGRGSAVVRGVAGGLVVGVRANAGCRRSPEHRRNGAAGRVRDRGCYRQACCSRPAPQNYRSRLRVGFPGPRRRALKERAGGGF